MKTVFSSFYHSKISKIWHQTNRQLLHKKFMRRNSLLPFLCGIHWLRNQWKWADNILYLTNKSLWRFLDIQRLSCCYPPSVCSMYTALKFGKIAINANSDRSSTFKIQMRRHRDQNLQAIGLIRFLSIIHGQNWKSIGKNASLALWVHKT